MMIKHVIAISGCILFTVCALNGFAAEPVETNPAEKTETNDTIKVTVHTDEKTAAGIGCKVEGKELGGAGTSYTCEGPKNTAYSFGYRKDSPKGPDIPCGSLTLDKDRDVNLVVKEGKCESILTQ